MVSQKEQLLGTLGTYRDHKLIVGMRFSGGSLRGAFAFAHVLETS